MRRQKAQRTDQRTHQKVRGAVLFLVALCIVPILIVAAIVIDLGQLRATRRSSQSASDLAALAAGNYLSGRSTAGATADPQGACAAVMNSLRTNIGDLPAATALDCTPFPAAVTTCTMATQTISATNSSPYQISVQ